MEAQKKYPLNIPAEIALFNILPPNVTSVHFGSYYRFQNSKIGFWNNLNLSGGIYLKKIEFTEWDGLDYGAACGLGIEFLGNTQSIDIAVRVGKKESPVLIGEYENYTSFHVGISTGEKWFMKRRRK